MPNTTVSIAHPTDRPNFTRVTVGDLTLWFSYETIVAFRHDYEQQWVSENLWGPTTGKHLGLIENNSSEQKARRLPRIEFEIRLADVLKRAGVSA